MSNCAAQVLLGKLLKIFAAVDKDGSNAIGGSSPSALWHNWPTVVEPPELVEVLQGFYKGLTEEKLLEQATAVRAHDCGSVPDSLLLDHRVVRHQWRRQAPIRRVRRSVRCTLWLLRWRAHRLGGSTDMVHCGDFWVR